MSTYTDRLGTFYSVYRIGKTKHYISKYPSTAVAPSALARAGYFYEGDGDTVRCRYCGVRAYDWQSNDDPVAFHQEVMPSCPFVVFYLL